MLILHTDGGSRGNPGLAGVGWVLHLKDQVYAYGRGVLGVATNNEAEYRGLIEGLKYIRDLPEQRSLLIRSDSQLIVRQITGEYRCNGQLAPLYEQSKELLHGLDYRIEWCPRLSNQGADQLVNQALDSRLAYGAVTVFGQGLGNYDPLALQLRSKHYASYPKDYRGG